MLREFKTLCVNKNYNSLFILFLGLVIGALLELIGIGSIPIFVMLITDINLLKSKLPHFIDPQIFDVINTNSLIFFGAISLTLIFVIKNLYLSLIIYYQGIVFKNLRINLASKLFSLYTKTKYSFHLQNNPAILLRNIEGEASKAISVIQSMISLFKELLILMMIFLLLLFADPLISSLAFIFLSFFVGIFYLVTNKKIFKNGKIIQFIRGEQVKHINHSFGAIKEVKILSKENFLYKIFLKNMNIFEKAYLTNYFLTALPRLFLEVIVLSTLIIVVTIFLYIDRNINNLIPLLSLLVIAAVRLMPSFNTISTSLARIRDLSPSYNLVAGEITKLQNQRMKFINNENKNLSFENSILINNIFFKYEKSEKYALKDLKLNIKAGSKIGIIGNSGAGKSTFVDLILGLLIPTKGTIEVDNQDININLKGWQNLIGYVPQDIYLLDETIQNNIAFGINEELFEEKKFQKAIKIAQLDEFIDSLELGKHTMIGNRGVRLSGGQRQRIGIARALYNDKKILVFDEATNSLDLENEKKIIENIFSKDMSKTLFLVTHRHETVKNCDEVLLFNEGKLIDQGQYDYLNKKYNLTVFIEKKNKPIE